MPMASTESDSSKMYASRTTEELNHATSNYSDVDEVSKSNDENHYAKDKFTVPAYIKEKQHIPWYQKYTFKWRVVVIYLMLLWPTAVYGILTFPYIQRYKTALWIVFTHVLAEFGVAGGIHRLWSHKSYKAKLPLQIILAIGFVSSLQAPFRHWIITHRVHHKFADTNADPHDSNKGFFFSHMGWLMVKKHPDVVDKYKEIDMTDIDQNAVVNFFDRHIRTYSFIVTAVEILVPVLLWNEEWKYAIMAQIIRFIIGSNIAASVNSFGHLWGPKPFNTSIKPTDNKFVAYFTFGEGWHNYHHVFPFDYRTPEFMGYLDINGILIDLFAKIGWAYDLRMPTDESIKRIMKNKGDKTLYPLLVN